MDDFLHLLTSLACSLAPLDQLRRLSRFKFRVTSGIASIHQYCICLSLGLPKMSSGRVPCLLSNICSFNKTHSSTQSCSIRFICHFMGYSSIQSGSSFILKYRNKYSCLYQQVIQPNNHSGSRKRIRYMHLRFRAFLISLLITYMLSLLY